MSSKSFKDSGFLNLHGKDLQTVMEYKSADFCDRTAASDSVAVNKDTTVYLSTELYEKKLGVKDGRGLYWTDDLMEELPIRMAGSGLGKNL